MNTKNCPGAKQSKAGDQAIPPSYKRRANQGTGSRQHHRTTKEALGWATFCTHVCKFKGASLRTSGLLQTCCISYWLTVDRSRSVTKAAQPYCLICWITRGHGMWWNPRTRKGRALPHKDSSTAPGWLFLPWSSPQGPSPNRKQSEPWRRYFWDELTANGLILTHLSKYYFL